ncbi:MAG: hypothetical protein E7403_02370 [Ruminococcaceae bacterium]|nr:hypothetical protein [Oscillospiraceae bacterium]
MEFSISKEAIIFLSSCATGGLIFFVYDLFRLIRRAEGSVYFMVHIQDGLFWAITFCIIFFSVLYVNNGILRMYEFLGAVLGAVLYKLMLSKLILAILQRILTIFSIFFKKFLKILLTPLRFAYNIIFGSLYFLCMPLIRLARKGVRKVLKSGKQTLRFVKKQ